MALRVIQGDCRETLRTLDERSVQCVVTSPPYYGLRDYGVNGQIGLEDSPEKYVSELVSVFREVRRVLKDDGTLWLNLGDSYYNYRPGGTSQVKQSLAKHQGAVVETTSKRNKVFEGIKEKDLIGIPWMVAFALRADGWYLRQDIIWAKPNPMPESVTDRCTKSHEYIFLLTKNKSYYYDQDAIREPAKDSSVARLAQDAENQIGSDRVPGKTNGRMKAVKFGGSKYGESKDVKHNTKSGKEWVPTQADGALYITANKKTVWTVATKPYTEAHFATFPPELIEPCILAGSKEGDIVLDPFNGSGTTGAVALKHRRHYIGCELNPDYIELTHRRFSKVQPVLFQTREGVG